MTDIHELTIAHTSFLDFLKSQKRAHATILAYGKDIDQLVSYLTKNSKKTIDEVTKEDVTAFLKKLEADGYTAKSISRKINSIKTFYRFLRTQGISKDISTEISHPKYDVKPPRILSQLEYRALRDACRDDIRISAIVELLLQTGIRIGELASLTTDDIDDKKNELHVPSYESHPERTVPLNKAGKTALDRYLKIRPKSESRVLFVTKTGRPLLIRNIRTAIDRYFRLAGIQNVKVNDLRHTFIAHHLMSGAPLTLISKLVGHKRLSTTEKYLDLIKDKVQENVRLEEL